MPNNLPTPALPPKWDSVGQHPIFFRLGASVPDAQYQFARARRPCLFPGATVPVRPEALEGHERLPAPHLVMPAPKSVIPAPPFVMSAPIFVIPASAGTSPLRHNVHYPRSW